MTEDLPVSYIDIVCLGVSVTTESAQSIIDTVMSVYNNRNIPSVAALKKEIREHFQFQGFRKGKSDKAPQTQIRLALADHWYKIPSLCEVVLNIWCGEKQDLFQTCNTWLDDHITEINKLLEVETQVNGESEKPSLMEFLHHLSHQIFEINSELATVDEIDVALSMQMQRKILMKEKEMNNQSVNNEDPLIVVWNDLLDVLKQIPAEDKRWQSTSEFIQAVQALADSKLIEKEQQIKYKDLEQALEKHLPLIKKWAIYFDVNLPKDWLVVSLVPSNIELLQEKVILLAEKLELYEVLDQQKPINRSERAQLDKKRIEAEEQIFTYYDELKTLLSNESQLDYKKDHQNLPSSPETQLTKETEVPIFEEEISSSPPTMVVQEDTIIEDDLTDSKQTKLTPNVVVDETTEEVLDVPSQEIKPILSPSDLQSDPILPSEVSNNEAEIPSLRQQNKVEQSSENKLNEEIKVNLTLGENDIEPKIDVNDKINNYLINNDLPNAYWLIWSQEAQNKNTLYPSKLIAALQGAFWLVGLWPEHPTNFITSISSLIHPENQQFDIIDEPNRLLKLTAGIFYSLLDPLGGWLSWIETSPHSKLSLKKIIELVLDANSKHIYLDPGIVQLVVNSEQVDQQILSLVNKAKIWLLNSENRGAKYFRAAQVWDELVRPSNGELYKLVDIVANDRRNQINELDQQLRNWQNRIWIDRHLQQIDQDLRQKKGNAIVGNARNQIIGWVEDICSIAADWCNIVKNQEEAKQGHSWKIEQTKSLCEGLNNLIKPIREEVKKLIDTGSELNMEIAYSFLDSTLKGLQFIVSPQSDMAIDDWPKPKWIKNSENESTSFTFNDCLVRSLVFYSELDLGDNGMPDPMNARNIEKFITESTNKIPEDIIQEWINQRDYRFVNSLLEDVDQRELWETRIREAIRSDVTYLTQKVIEETKIDVEQALLEGIIAEEEHTEYISRIESAFKLIRQVERDDFAKISFRKLSGSLQNIAKELNIKRKDRLSSHSNHWERMMPDIRKIIGSDDLFFEKIKSVVETSLSENDLRATGEYLAHLDNVITYGRIPEKTLYESQSSSEINSFMDFQEILPNIVSLLEPRSQWSILKIKDTIQGEGSLPKVPMKSLPKPRRDEVTRTLDAWRRLKSDGANETQAHLQNIQTLMNYLGFILSDNSPISIKSLPGGLPNFQYWKVSASVKDFSPVAQFGSQRNGYYDILGVWDRPGFEIIGSQVSSLMQQTGNQPTILFYFHYLTSAKRESLMSHTRKYGLPMLIIDEGLLLFLAREQDTRIKPMFQCTLPYAALNPYFPSAAGLVPPEIYKGRHDLVRKLIDPYGSAIVFGGRQLGKSALLRQTQREFHHPENNQFVIYEDIKSVGDPASGRNYQVEFRDRFAQALVNLKLIEPQRSTLDLDKLFNHLQQQVLINGKRLLLLLDESDHFLDADAGKNFIIIQKIKTLMDQSGRNFKVVLAGLHNVQRFQRISNQPLAHLGTPIEIGPLEPKAALDLLVDPLHALGYRFGQNPEKEDNSLVLHILSYTNYHPGLIQLFGSYLCEHLLSKYQQPNHPSLLITRSDVEAVYRKKEVRDAICERFNWTLALDPRYEAITLALILEQWEDQNGFDRLFTPKQLRDLSFSWWPEAFGEEITPERFKSFLDEMRGLGVLSVSIDGNYYRLRSPNLVYLMGTYEQILDRIDTLAGTTPPGEKAMESFHAHLDVGVFSPFTFAQERALNNPKSGVALLFGSNALGFANLDNALRRLLPDDSGAWKEIRIASRGYEAIQQQLKVFIKANPDSNFFIAYRDLDCNSVQMRDEVLSAIRFCNQIKGRITLRVTFGLNPQSAWQWFQLPREQREALEEQAEVNLSLKRWDLIGVKQLLEMDSGDGQPIFSSDRSLSRILDITGGWPNLLEGFIKQCKINKLETSLDLIKQDLLNHQTTFSQSFINSIGIFDELPTKLINILCQDEIQEMLKEKFSYLDVIQTALKNYPPDTIENIVDYLHRLSVVTTEPYLALDSAFARAWHVS